MPTIIEINKPHLTYCQKYDVHCFCPKCIQNNRQHYSCPNSIITQCDECDESANTPTFMLDVLKYCIIDTIKNDTKNCIMKIL